jgi:hypothetical protein
MTFLTDCIFGVIKDNLSALETQQPFLEWVNEDLSIRADSQCSSPRRKGS